MPYIGSTKQQFNRVEILEVKIPESRKVIFGKLKLNNKFEFRFKSFVKGVIDTLNQGDIIDINGSFTLGLNGWIDANGYKKWTTEIVINGYETVEQDSVAKEVAEAKAEPETVNIDDLLNETKMTPHYKELMEKCDSSESTKELEEAVVDWDDIN